eukprot:TRINITY_DN3074_c0_g1_i16.p1 TRINITY_DN3074_c0_g1~~TRINITY_DN3074_c0_g1_i16.p1  ORF type:complete len:303 (-),score=-31.07 TRINITY_DN3074_c0_g1_i16:27-935(-)
MRFLTPARTLSIRVSCVLGGLTRMDLGAKLSKTTRFRQFIRLIFVLFIADVVSKLTEQIPQHTKQDRVNDPFHIVEQWESGYPHRLTLNLSHFPSTSRLYPLHKASSPKSERMTPILSLLSLKLGFNQARGAMRQQFCALNLLNVVLYEDCSSFLLDVKILIFSQNPAEFEYLEEICNMLLTCKVFSLWGRQQKRFMRIRLLFFKSSLDAHYKPRTVASQEKYFYFGFYCEPPSLSLQNQKNSLWQRLLLRFIRMKDGQFSSIDASKFKMWSHFSIQQVGDCLLYTSPSPRDGLLSRMPSSA